MIQPMLVWIFHATLIGLYMISTTFFENCNIVLFVETHLSNQPEIDKSQWETGHCAKAIGTSRAAILCQGYGNFLALHLDEATLLPQITLLTLVDVRWLDTQYMKVPRSNPTVPNNWRARGTSGPFAFIQQASLLCLPWPNISRGLQGQRLFRVNTWEGGIHWALLISVLPYVKALACLLDTRNKIQGKEKKLFSENRLFQVFGKEV